MSRNDQPNPYTGVLVALTDDPLVVGVIADLEPAIWVLSPFPVRILEVGELHDLRPRVGGMMLFGEQRQAEAGTDHACMMADAHRPDHRLRLGICAFARVGGGVGDEADTDSLFGTAFFLRERVANANGRGDRAPSTA